MSVIELKFPLWHPILVLRETVNTLRVLLLICVLLPSAGLYAQRERRLPPPDDAYGSKFFDQLRSIFGIFRESDLRRAFESAQPIQCSELVVSRGEWRTVAFFNEDQTLGEWCRNSIGEVRSDLSVYTFAGACTEEHGSVQVKTEFPVGKPSVRESRDYRVSQ